MVIEKKVVQEKLLEIISEKISTAQKVIIQIQESKAGETKSSAGDKFETGRAMLQMEEDKASGQLQKSLILRNQLQQLDIDKTHNTIAHGSLIVTSKGIYFICIGLGKVQIKGKNIYCISTDAPFSKYILGKKVNDVIIFNGIQHIMQSVN